MTSGVDTLPHLFPEWILQPLCFVFSLFSLICPGTHQGKPVLCVCSVPQSLRLEHARLVLLA